jgi:hypothetical protein
MSHYREKVGATYLLNAAILWQVMVPLMVRKTHPTFFLK